MKEIILIGGAFHRERHTVRDNEHTLRIPFPIEARLMSINDFSSPEPIAYEEYGSVMSILGEYEIIPNNVFLSKSLNPVLFLKNLVLDYTK